MGASTALYPLFFSFVELVKGTGFVAGVMTKGRALMVHEDDGSWWMYGVQPGGMAATGATFKEASHGFSDSFKAVLFDIAESCGTYEQFATEVRRFYCQKDDEDEARWNAARDIFRSGMQNLEPSVPELPKVTEPDPTAFKVERLDLSAVIPDNRLDIFQTAA